MSSTSRGGRLRQVITKRTQRHRRLLYEYIEPWWPGLADAIFTTWGPMNDQAARRAVVIELFKIHPVSMVVETGSYHGTTTGFLALASGAPTVSVELSPRRARVARHRIPAGCDVTLFVDDSRRVLSNLANEPSTPTDGLFFYLDAHWGEDLPLVGELELIAARWPSALILIDDFEVPGEPGYGFDRYGPGRVLTSAILPPAVLSTHAALYPSTPAAKETGSRRGWVLLCPRAAAAQLAEQLDLTVG